MTGLLPEEKRILRYKLSAKGSVYRHVRAFCVECMGGEAHEVPNCTSPDCPLYPWRWGVGKGGSSPECKRTAAELEAWQARIEQKCAEHGVTQRKGSANPTQVGLEGSKTAQVPEGGAGQEGEDR